MANKSFKILSLSILFLIVIMSSISALDVEGSILSTSSGEHIIQLSITGATPNAIVTFKINSNEDLSGITFDAIDDLELIDDKTSGQVNLTYEIPVDFEFEFEKEYSMSVIADDGTSTIEKILIFEENTNFYEGENQEDLEISDLEFNTLSGFGDDEDYWYPFDEVLNSRSEISKSS